MDPQLPCCRAAYPAGRRQSLQRFEQRCIAVLRVLQERAEQLVDESTQRIGTLHFEQQPKSAQGPVRRDVRATPCTSGQSQRLARLHVRPRELGDPVRQVADAHRRGPGFHHRGSSGQDLRAELLDRREVRRQLVRDQEHRGRGPHQGQGSRQSRADQPAQRAVQPILLPARRERGLRLVVIRFEHDHPCPLRQAVAEPLRLPRHPLRLLGLQTAGQNLFDQVAAQPAPDFSGSALLGQLEGQHRRAVLERPEAALGVDSLFEAHREHPQHVAPGAHRHHVQRARRAARRDPNLAGDAAGRGRNVDPGRHAISRFARQTHSVTVDRIQRGSPTRE